MTTKHEIEIPGLPEGWRAVAFRKLNFKDQYLTEQGIQFWSFESPSDFPYLIVEKIKPRRIVLEETAEKRKANDKEWCEQSGGYIFQSEGGTISMYKIWREVK